MSALFRAQHSDAHRTTRDLASLLDDDGQSGRYLTDGVNLYRSLGAFVRGPCQMVGLEDCRSLDIILVSSAELRGRRLRPVAPSHCDHQAVLS